MQARAQRVISSLSESSVAFQAQREIVAKTNSLTRAKREIGAKRDVKIRKPFLSLICTELRGSEENYSLLRGLKSVNFRERRVEQGAKFSSFREISEFLSDCEIPRGGGDIPTPL